jgi:polar amino acid transport system substrate-binding protein
VRTLAIVAAAGSLVLAACAQNTPSTAAPPSPGATLDCSQSALHLYKPGQLTVATDSPAYPPWFAHNNPANGQGYESAVAFAVAAQLGFSKDQVKWVVEPFNSSYAPGPKKFDFDINEISVTPARAQVVTFSDGYYDVTQALVALKSSSLIAAHSPADLTAARFGAQIGTTSLAYVEQQIAPTTQPSIFDTTNDAKQSLTAGHVDGLVLDLPTASYVSAFQIKGSTVIGQFPSTGEHFGLLFE